MIIHLSLVYDDDTYLVSYPRSGNTWIRYLIANIVSPEKKWHLNNISEVVPDIYENDITKYKRPRIIKSHEPYQKEYPKVIYLYRDGRDLSISYYHLYQTAYDYTGSFTDFLNDMLSGNVYYGSWQEHIHSWMFRKHAIPFLAVQYENLCEKPVHVMQEISNFIGLNTDEKLISAAITNSTFEKQKQDVISYSPHYSKGFRGGIKGGPGKWKEIFDDRLLDLFWGIAGQTMVKLGYTLNG